MRIMIHLIFDLPENTSEYQYSWLPAIVPVTGDASYTLTSTKKTFIQ